MWEYNPQTGKYEWVPKGSQFGKRDIKQFVNQPTGPSISNWVSDVFNKRALEDELEKTEDPFYREEILKNLDDVEKGGLGEFEYLQSTVSPGYKIEDEESKDYFKYLKRAEERLGKPLFTTQDPYAVLAKDQTTGEQIGRTIGNLIPNIGLGLIETVGYLGELPGAIIGSDRDFSNSLTEFAKAGKNQLFGETYREQPSETFDFSDSAWWLQNGAGLVESIGQFAITGFGVGSVLGKAGSALANSLKLGQTGTRITAGLIPQLSTAATLAYAEGAMSGADVYKEVYNDFLNKTGDAEFANQKASEAASTTVALNTGINTLLNVYSVAPIFKNANNIRYTKSLGLNQIAGETSEQYLKRLSSLPAEYAPSLKRTLGKYALEAPMESMEEVVNVFSERRGLEGRGILDSENFVNDFIDAAMSDEGILSASLGAVGGIGNIAAVDNMPSFKKADNKLGFTLGPSVRQQEIAQKKKQYAGAVLSLKEDLTDYFNQTEELKKAAESGDIKKTEEAKEKLFNISARRSIVEGVGDNLISTLEEVKNVDNTEASMGPDGKTDAMRQGLATNLSDNKYKETADEKIKEIKTLQTEFNNFFTKYNSKDIEAPGYLKHLFSAYLGSYSTFKTYSKDLENFKKAELDYNSFVMSLQDILLTEPEETREAKSKELNKQLKESPQFKSLEDAKKSLQSSLTTFTEANQKYNEALDFELYKKKLNGFIDDTDKKKEKNINQDTDSVIAKEDLFQQLTNAGYSADPKTQGIGRSFAFEFKSKDQDGNEVTTNYIAERVRDPQTGNISILIKDSDTGLYLKDNKGNNLQFTLDFFKKNRNSISVIPMESHMQKRTEKILKKRREIQLEALRAVSQDFQNEVNSLNQQIKTAEESIQNANKEIEELQNDLSKHIKDRTHKLNKKQINNRIKELNKTIKTLKNTIPQLEATRDALFPKLEALRVLEEQLISIPADQKVSIENTITDIADVVKQLPSVSETLQDLETMLSSTEDAILTLRQEVEKLEKLVKEIEDIIKDSEYISALQGRAIMESTFRAKYPGFPIPVKGLYDALEFNKNREAVNAYLRRLAREQGRTLDEVREEFTDHLMAYDEAELKANERFQLDEDLKVANSRLLEARQTLKEHLDTYVAKSEDRNNLLKLKLIADNLQSEISTISGKAQMINIRTTLTGRVNSSQLSGEPEVTNPSEVTVSKALDTFLSSFVFYTTGLNVEYTTNEEGEITGTKYDDNGNPVIKPGYQKGWFAFLDKYGSLFRKEKSPYKLKLVVRADPNTPANLKALMDKQVGTKGSDLDVGAFLVDDKGNLVTINDQGEFDPDGYPAFTFLPKAQSLFTNFKKPKVNWNGLTDFYMQTNPGIGSVPYINKKKDDAEVIVGGKKMTVAEFKKLLVDNAIDHYTKFIDTVKVNQSKGAFVDIETVSNGIALRAKNPETGKNKFQSLKELLKKSKSKLKQIHVAKGEDGAVTINSVKYFYNPGTIIVELEDGTFFPVFTSNIGKDDNRAEIDTILYLIYTGRADFNASINLPEKNFTLGGAKSIRIFPKNQSNRFSLLGNLINWGKVDYKTSGPSLNPKDKYEIYIQSGKVIFKDPTNEYKPTFINVEDVMDNNKNTKLVALLSEKRYNVSLAALQGGNYMYFHPKYNPKTGQLTFEKFNSYNDYLFSKLMTFTFVNPEGQMMASRNIVLKTDAKGMPILSNTPTITTEEVEPDYPEMPDFNESYEEAIARLESALEKGEAAIISPTGEGLYTPPSLRLKSEEEEVPSEVKTIKPAPTPTAPTDIKDKKAEIEGKHTFTRDSLKEISDGSGLAKKGTEILNPEKVASQLKVGDKITFYAEKERTGVWDGKTIREDKSNNPFGILGILSSTDGYIKNQSAINTELDALEETKLTEPTAPLTSLEWDALSEDVRNKLESMEGSGINEATWSYLNDEEKTEYINKCLK